GVMVGAECTRTGLRVPKTQANKALTHSLRIGPKAGTGTALPEIRKDATDEAYNLVVRPDVIVVQGKGAPGLFYGVQTLCQLIRANQQGKALPCLAIRDWPSLRWRAFQDDITRGPSSTLEELQREVALGAYFKHNLFTYYMESQYAWAKHPLIGPKDGSLKPEELKALVAFGKPLHMDILGNQQSFGHFGHILKHEKYAPLRETGNVLCPVKEESYQLLDDLYSEVIPHLPLPFFNVCCDETWGLGKGPSKALAAKIGVGGVYAQHLLRVHDLLKDKYGKRMMMWGDIILQHPEHLKDIPKDTIMLTWGYGAKASFEDQIIPFAKSGYDFFVCPGVSNWSRILPDFGVAMTNIRNFVRDGAKHGAIGMLNTSWDDDGCNLNAPNWHGFAWGAECAWNASKTEPEDFNRRIGAVLFGETGDHFGQAIMLLAKTHRLPGMHGMNNRRYWQDDLTTARTTVAVQMSSQKALATLVGPAVEHLLSCKEEATANGGLLDAFLLGAMRMNLIAERGRAHRAATKAYREAYEGKNIEGSLSFAHANIESCHIQNEAVATVFRGLWNRENRPYALDWSMGKFQTVTARYKKLDDRLAAIRKDAAAGKPLPAPAELGFDVIELGKRKSTAQRIVKEPLTPDAPWQESGATSRIGLTVAAGKADRFDLPIELDVPAAKPYQSQIMRAWLVPKNGTPRQLLAQVDGGRLTAILDGPLPKDSRATIHLYFGVTKKLGPTGAHTSDGPKGAKWVESGNVRLLLGPEGAHVYRWEVKSLGNRDLAMPGGAGWSGFADSGRAHRGSPNKLECVARGPALVRYTCTDSLGLVKTISLFGNVAWIEVTTNMPLGYYWNFDNPQNFAADGPTPGAYLFSTGAAGKVGTVADGAKAQAKAKGAYWGVKFVPGKLALGLVTPEVKTTHAIGPGGNFGGVGIEGAPAASHFVTYAGPLTEEPAKLMSRLQQTLDFRNPPEIVLYGVQTK
ncbi:family 20 glycosylhydrolase, partial [bacterium]|nr:family 20 glycosylhydrolase [bacterium]